MPELSEDLQRDLLEIVKLCEEEGKFVRSEQVRRAKKAEEFWKGNQFLYWSEVAHDWKNADASAIGELGEEGRDISEPFYNYVVNIYKAHGESIIAALSIRVPYSEYFPDDADNADDIAAAKAKSKIAIILQRHNKAKMKLIHALYLLYTQELVAAYSYSKASKKFGTYKIPKYEPQDVIVNTYSCSVCGAPLGNDEGEEQEAVQDMNTLPTCATCGETAPPVVASETIKRPTYVGDEEMPKARSLFDVYGLLNVKVPHYVRSLKEAGYLILYVEQHESYLQSLYGDEKRYPGLKEKIKAEAAPSTDRWARSVTPYGEGADVNKLCTVKRVWLRPWMFESLGKAKEDNIRKLKELFPDGCYVCVIGNEYAESENSNMDDCWSLAKAGPSNYIHAPASGNALIPIQEMRNTLVNMTLETAEHSIPSGFADPAVLNFDEFGKKEVMPAVWYPAKARPGKTLGQGFHETRPATISREIDAFASRLDQDAQFVTGSFPSIYGGPSEGKTRTLGEYQQSRMMALQRLGISWEIVSQWWSEVIDKCVNIFIQNMYEDEKFTTKSAGRFINTWIRKEDLRGRTGHVEPETSESFPITSAQKRDLLTTFIGFNNPMIDAVISHSENVKNISQAIGFPDLYLPGEDQRLKQMREVDELLKFQAPEGVPIEALPLPTVLPEPEVDDDGIHIETLRAFLASEEGQWEKKTNLVGYANAVAHLAAHRQNLELKTMQQFGETPPGEPPETVGE